MPASARSAPTWAVFSLITIAAAATLSAAAHRTVRPLIAAAVVGAVTVIVLVANLAGTLLYQWANGSNTQVGGRLPIEMDIYGLRPIQLVTPTPLTRLSFLRGIGHTLSTGYTSESSMYLGVVFATVFVAMLGWLALRVAGNNVDSRPPTAQLLALLAVFWILVAITGGFDWLLQLVSFDRIRGWDRSSILIEFLVAVWGGLIVAPWLARHVRRLPWPATSATVVSVIVLIVGIADQTGLASSASVRAANAVQLASDQDFFVGLEHELPVGASVFQLPVRRFPEEQSEQRSADYDLVRPFLLTEHLRWSYGGMKFRDAEWQQLVARAAPDELLDDLVATGFQGLVIDRFGYPDGGAAIEAGLTALRGQPVRVSPDGRWSYVPVRRTDSSMSDAQLAARRRWLFSTPMISPNEGCFNWEHSGNDTFFWCGAQGTLLVAVAQPTDQPANVRLSVTAPAGAGTIQFTSAGTTTNATVGPQAVRIELPVPAGERYAEISFTATVPPINQPRDPRHLNFQIRADPPSASSVPATSPHL